MKTRKIVITVLAVTIFAGLIAFINMPEESVVAAINACKNTSSEQPCHDCDDQHLPTYTDSE